MLTLVMVAVSAVVRKIFGRKDTSTSVTQDAAAETTTEQ